MNFQKTTDDELAIVGMALRVPGCANVEEFWDGLTQRRCSLDVDEARTTAERSDGWVYSSGRLEGVDEFDAEFFRIPSADAEALDPQQRLFLESCYHALETAGYGRQEARPRTGVFASAAYVTYEPVSAGPSDQLALFKHMLALDKDFLATRVSYLLGLSGPSVNVQTACSSSLVAVHYACQSLLAGECDLALAGGVSIALPQRDRYRYVPDMIFSRDGYCRPFDHRSSGTVLANGLGVVLLARLDDAIERGDDIIAVVKGSAVGNDAHRKASFTAPSKAGQVEVLQEALRVAQLSVDAVGYIEAHGTATKVGDAIELGALAEVYASRSREAGRIALGSAKANIGHLNTAAGVIGLIKAALMVQRRTLVGMPNYERPNPLLEIDETPFEVCAESRVWPTVDGVPPVAGVSSFGIGGTNAHVLLAGAPTVARAIAPDTDSGPRLYVVSGKTLASYRENSRAHAAFLRKSEVGWAAASAAALSREHFAFRTAIVACDRIAGSEQLLAAVEAPACATTLAGKGGVALVFPSSAGLSPEAVRGLREGSTAFRTYFDECSASVRDLAGVDGAGGNGRGASTESRLAIAAALESMCQQYALYRFWSALGLRATYLIGRGAGELAALACAGAISFVHAAQRIHAGQLSGFEAPESLSTRSGARVLFDRTQAEHAGCDRQLVAHALGTAGLRLHLGVIASSAAEGEPGAHADVSLRGRVCEQPWHSLLLAVADVVNAGCELNLSLLAAERGHAACRLPAYAFDRRRYWHGTPANGETEQAPARGAERPASETPREALARILRDVCGPAWDGSATAKSWLDLGIESLAAIEIVERLRQALKVDVDVLRFYECQTFDGLYACIENEMAAMSSLSERPRLAADPSMSVEWIEHTV